jgi:hypothetical protein
MASRIQRFSGWLVVRPCTSDESVVDGSLVRNDYSNSVDATSGILTSLRTMNQTLSLKTTPGYDDVTGVGTPTGTFIDALR